MSAPLVLFAVLSAVIIAGALKIVEGVGGEGVVVGGGGIGELDGESDRAAIDERCGEGSGGELVRFAIFWVMQSSQRQPRSLVSGD